MARYFFDIRDGEFFPDEVGSEFVDLEAARIHAVVRSGELLKENPSRFWEGEEWQLEVRDEARRVLFILTFMATNSPDLPRTKLSRSRPGGG
ncbi:DUF6894 family protein [Phenylobacterium sp.]|uniref:DUF6894 family protein n=1 Tax=Phenylobacterium sp. TaxID=1871053 RepID=UPI002CFF97F7|nr:hypothetical protein [Phenylobacterium sp.]HLZ73947.1 hypothetical protein [Phenylobacterium sp.]